MGKLNLKFNPKNIEFYLNENQDLESCLLLNDFELRLTLLDRWLVQHLKIVNASWSPEELQDVLYQVFNYLKSQDIEEIKDKLETEWRLRHKRTLETDLRWHQSKVLKKKQELDDIKKLLKE